MAARTRKVDQDTAAIIRRRYFGQVSFRTLVAEYKIGVPEIEDIIVCAGPYKGDRDHALRMISHHHQWLADIQQQLVSNQPMPMYWASRRCADYLDHDTRKELTYA